MPREGIGSIALLIILCRRKVGSVETLAPLQTTWLATVALPQTLFTSTLTFEPIEAPEPTTWLLLTRVLFMVVMSIRLPAAAPVTVASPASGVDVAGQVRPIVLQVDLAVDDGGTGRAPPCQLPAPPDEDPSFQLP